jgi:hypothetical protein
VIQHVSAAVVPVRELLDYECHIADMVETRAAPRYRVMKPAKIEFGGYKRECVIRDLSTTGAALEVMDQTSIPKHFNLVVPADNLKLPCAIVWRRGFRIGVMFD